MSPENEENFREEDQEFFKGLDEQFEGNYPGLPEVVDRLCFEELGKPIATAEIAISETNSEARERRLKVVGVTLPVTKEGKDHYWVFNTGDMLRTESYDKDREVGYSRMLSPSQEPFAVTAKSV